MTSHQRRVDFSMLPGEASCCFSVATKKPHLPAPKTKPNKQNLQNLCGSGQMQKWTAIQHRRDKSGRVVEPSLTDPQPWGRPDCPAASPPSVTILGCPTALQASLLRGSSSLQGGIPKTTLCPTCSAPTRPALFPSETACSLRAPAPHRRCLLSAIPPASQELRNSSKPGQETASGTGLCFRLLLMSLRPVLCQWIPHHWEPWPTWEPSANNPGL